MMTDQTQQELEQTIQRVAEQFRINGTFRRAHPHGNGHIHDTYASYFVPEGEDQVVRYVHQRINQEVFPDVDDLMENIERVTGHVRKKVKRKGGDPNRDALSLVRTRDGDSYLETNDGEAWRTYHFIDGARSIEVPEKPVHVYSAGKAFGQFQNMLTDLSGPPLHEIIEDFHNTRKRFQRFVKVLEEDPVDRAKRVEEEISFVLEREEDTSVLLDLKEQDQVPVRITHNDTKINNVMIDHETDEGVCVIDLDTVMNGLSLYDYGDSIRTGASTAAEDEQDLSKVGVDLELFEALTKGYLETAGSFLNETERNHMVFSAKLMTLEVGMRFLTDFLNGDQYFKVDREDHNLDRCRTQLKMVEEIENKRERLERIVENCLG